jgi:hypothetical protein
LTELVRLKQRHDLLLYERSISTTMVSVATACGEALSLTVTVNVAVLISPSAMPVTWNAVVADEGKVALMASPVFVHE